MIVVYVNFETGVKAFSKVVILFAFPPVGLVRRIQFSALGRIHVLDLGMLEMIVLGLPNLQ